MRNYDTKAARPRYWPMGRGAILVPYAACLVLLLSGASVSDARAAPAGRVESVQIPAWLERNGSRIPIDAGLQLEAGDVLRTGPHARLLLRLAEGSLVKLGADAEFKLQSLESAGGGGLFEGILDVVKGAFRFTTTLLSQAHRRRIDVRVANVTAGIRGTDLWGKAALDRDIVCLIEGEITVKRGADAAISMSEPLSFFVAPKDRAPLPVAPVNPEQLQRWARETDIAEHAPALVIDGAWTVYLESLSTPDAAEGSRAALAEQGFPASIQRAEVGGRTFYRVTLTGFGSWQGAIAFRDGAAEDLGFRSAWVAAP